MYSKTEVHKTNMTNKNKSKQRNNKNIDKHMKAGDIEWNVNEIEYASVLGDNILQNNKFWCLREKKTRNEVLEDIEDHINKIDVLISELKQEFYSVVTMSDNTKMSKQRKNLTQLGRHYEHCPKCNAKFMIPQSQSKMEDHVKKCRGKNPPPPPPPSPMSQGPVKNHSLVLNLEQTVDQELNESEASFMPSTQPSQQSQDQPSQDQTADESMFISGVTVASTQDVVGQDAIEHVVGREVTKQVKRLRTSPQKGVQSKTPRRSVAEEQVYKQIAVLENELEAEEAKAMAEDQTLTDTITDEVERRLEGRNVKNENQSYLDNNRDNSTSTNGSSVVEVGRVFPQDNNKNDESVNLLSSDGSGNYSRYFATNVQQENEMLHELEEKLNKASKVAADYINANNILKSENSHLKMLKEDLEEKNQDLETKNADLKTKINNIGDLHGIDVRNTMKLHEKIKMKETENQKLVMEMSEKDNVIHGLRTAERDLSDQIKEGERREAMMKKMIKERDEEKERLFSVTEKQKKIVDKKEEMILKLHGEAEQSSNKIQAYREREQDLLKKLQVVQKELEDCKNQMKDFKKSNEVTVQSHTQVVRSNEILLADNEARKRRDSFCVEQSCFDPAKCGKSHEKKSLQRFTCKFFARGWCREENNCPRRHVPKRRFNSISEGVEDKDDYEWSGDRRNFKVARRGRNSNVNQNPSQRPARTASYSEGSGNREHARRARYVPAGDTIQEVEGEDDYDRESYPPSPNTKRRREQPKPKTLNQRFSVHQVNIDAQKRMELINLNNFPEYSSGQVTPPVFDSPINDGVQQSRSRQLSTDSRASSVSTAPYEESSATGMTVAVDKINLNAHGILQQQQNSKYQSPQQTNVTPTAQSSRRSPYEHVNTPFPHHVNQDPSRNQDLRGFQNQGPGVRGISTIQGPESKPPGSMMMTMSSTMEQEQMMKDQREKRVQIQQELHKEPVRTHLGRVYDELDNQQFQVQQQRYQPVVEIEPPRTQVQQPQPMDYQTSYPQTNHQQQFPQQQHPPPYPSQMLLQRRASLQNQIVDLDLQLQVEQRKKASVYEAQYQEMKNQELQRKPGN